MPGNLKLSAFSQLHRLKSLRAKNIVRGALARAKNTDPPRDAINTIRATAAIADVAAATEILLGKEGAFPFSNTGRTYRDLLRPHTLKPVAPAAEVAFIIGHLNGWKDEVCNILDAMSAFARLPSSEPLDAMNALVSFVDHYGASSYSVRKAAYLMSRHGDDSSLQEPFQRMANRVGQQKHPAPYFTAMELLDTEFPLLPGVATRVQLYQKYVRDDFRQLLPLHDLVPVPLSEEDLSALLRKSHATSLIDEIVALLLLCTFSETWPSLYELVATLLDGGIRGALDRTRQVPFDASAVYSDASLEEADLVFYRRALAFVEFEACARYRADVDAVLIPRLLQHCSPQVDENIGSNGVIGVRDLTKGLHGFRNPADYEQIQACGFFLRTIQFLKFINSHTEGTFRLNHHEMKFICEHTTGLDLLLSEAEMEKFYLTADSDSRPLVTVLALALHKAKSADEDVDFKFRHSLCQTVNSQFQGRLDKFIEWLLPSSPQIANYLLSILDRATLQKLYWVIQSADEADTTRQALLRAVGRQRGAIEYFVEADAIEAQRQVSKLRQYFDDSRIYVDGIAMKEWLVANPSAYAQQYAKLIEHNISVTTARATLIENGQLVYTGTVDIPTVTAFDYILKEVARVAYEQFCTSRGFGIESYLGRRIRHNTLTGMMRGGVEDLIDRPEYRLLRFDNSFVAANDAFIRDYRKGIEYLRREILQFRTDAKPHGVFSATMRDDENTAHSIAALRNMILAARNTEIMNELLIRFCWQEIDPQLKAAAKIITVDRLAETHEQVELHLGHFNEENQKQYRNHLREVIHERFARLGSWFRQPEDGFVNASTRQLGELILVEARNGALIEGRTVEWDGDAVDLQLDGLSVHRMYDCLFVLLQNALKYGAPEGSVGIRVSREGPPNENVAKIKVIVTSDFADETEKEFHAIRLAESFSNDDLGQAMVMEGYSGIRKIRYITRTCEGASTVSYSVEGATCKFEFFLTAELAKEDGGHESSSDRR